MGGSWLAGQRPGLAEPVAGTARLCDIRVEGRSVSGLRPDSLHPVPCIGWVAHTDAQCACCWGSWQVLASSWAPRCTAWPAAYLYALGQWYAAWSRLARSSRTAGP